MGLRKTAIKAPKAQPSASCVIKAVLPMRFWLPFRTQISISPALTGVYEETLT